MNKLERQSFFCIKKTLIFSKIKKYGINFFVPMKSGNVLLYVIVRNYYYKLMFNDKTRS